MLMGIMGWIIVGLIAGFSASKLINLRGDDPNMGILLGGFGGAIGGWIYSAASGDPVTAFNFWSLAVAVGGAAVALVVWHAMRRHSFSRYG